MNTSDYEKTIEHQFDSFCKTVLRNYARSIYAEAKRRNERLISLDIPILAQSPLVYELEVAQSIELDGGEVVLCKIKNILADELMSDETISLEQRMKSIRSVQAIREEYFKWDGISAGGCCEPMKNIQRKGSEGK